MRPLWRALARASRLIPIGAAAATVLLFGLAATASMDARVVIADVEVPASMSARGFTPGRIELVLQQALQGMVDSDALVSTSAMPPGESSSRGRRIATLYDSAFAEIRNRPLAVVVPGQAVPLSLLVRRIAGGLPWAKRQSFVTLSVVDDDRGYADVSIAIDRSDAGMSVSRVQRPASQFLEPDSELMKQTALRILETVEPDLALTYLIDRDGIECNCIRASTVSFLSDSLETMRPIGIAAHLFRMYLWLRISSPSTTAVIDQYELVRKRMEFQHPNGPWKQLQLPESDAKPGDCMTVPETLLEIATSERERDAARAVGPAVASMCASLRQDHKSFSAMSKVVDVDIGGSPDKVAQLFASLAALQWQFSRGSSGQAREALEVASRSPVLYISSFAKLLIASIDRQPEDVVRIGDETLASLRRTKCASRTLADCWDHLGVDLLRRVADTLFSLDARADRVVEYCYALIAVQPRDPDAYACAGRAARRVGDHRRSDSLLTLAHERLVLRDPFANYTPVPGSGESEALDIRLEMARSLAVRGEAAKATQLLKASRKFDKFMVEPFLAGLAAERCAEREVRTYDPDKLLDSQWSVVRARKAIVRGASAEARAIARQMILAERSYEPLLASKLDFESTTDAPYQGHLLLGLALLADGDAEGAQRSLGRVLELAPGHAEAAAARSHAGAARLAPEIVRRAVCSPLAVRYGEQRQHPAAR